MALHLGTSFLLLIVGTLFIDAGTSAANSKPPFSLLIDFFNEGNSQKQQNNVAKISVVANKQSGIERTFKMSESQNPGLLNNIFKELNKQLAGRNEFVATDKTNQKSKGHCCNCPSNVVSEIRRVLDGRMEFSRVLEYLNLAEEDLVRQLPASSKGKSYFHSVFENE